MATELSNYQLETTALIFENDEDFIAKLVSLNIYDYDDEERQLKFINLSILLLDNNEYISENTIDSLAEERFLIDYNSSADSVASILLDGLKTDAEIEAYFFKLDFIKLLYYVFKYSTVKRFFRENYDKFIPDVDYQNIQNSEKTTLYIEAFMREFDKFAKIIDDLVNIVDIDRIPVEYLNYLAQIIGYERGDRVLLVDSSFRELLKNMIDIYRIKGSNYSFELFFNFLGFNITLSEYFFDRRFGDDSVTANPYTAATTKDQYAFYLTPVNPINGYPEGYEGDEKVITRADFVSFKNLDEFNKLIYDGDYTAKQLLGIDNGYTGTYWKYFKTNVIQYSITPFQKADGTYASLSETEDAIISQYVRFLTPIYLRKSLILNAPEEEDRLTNRLKLLEINILENNVATEPTFQTFVNGFVPKGWYYNTATSTFKNPSYTTEIDDSDTYLYLYNEWNDYTEYYTGDQVSRYDDGISQWRFFIANANNGPLLANESDPLDGSEWDEVRHFSTTNIANLPDNFTTQPLFKGDNITPIYLDRDDTDTDKALSAEDQQLDYLPEYDYDFTTPKEYVESDMEAGDGFVKNGATYSGVTPRTIPDESPYSALDSITRSDYELGVGGTFDIAVDKELSLANQKLDYLPADYPQILDFNFYERNDVLLNADKTVASVVKAPDNFFSLSGTTINGSVMSINETDIIEARNYYYDLIEYIVTYVP